LDDRRRNAGPDSDFGRDPGGQILPFSFHSTFVAGFGGFRLSRGRLPGRPSRMRDRLEQEANNQLDRRGIEKDRRPEIGGGGEKSAGPKRSSCRPNVAAPLSVSPIEVGTPTFTDVGAIRAHA